MKDRKKRIELTLILIIIHIIFGSFFIYSSAGENDPNFLIMPMSVSCIIVYYIALLIFDVEKYGSIGRLLFSYLTCAVIITLGIFFNIITLGIMDYIKYSTDKSVLELIQGFIGAIFESLLGGFIANIMTLVFNIIFTTINFTIISFYAKPNKIDKFSFPPKK